MKTLTAAFAAVLALAVATPAVLACPHEDKAAAEKKQEPQTADKTKADKAEKKDDTAKKDTAKKDTAAAPKADSGKVSSK